MRMREFPVVIAGGGPVGMTLARDLARRGIRTLLVERNPTTTRHPKMDITNARSMELFRRLGLAEALRAVAVPEANCFDVSWITGLSGHELHRFRYPSVAQARRLIRERNDGSQPREPAMRVSQVEIEPVLKRAIEGEPLVELRFGTAFEALEQDGEGVTVALRPADGPVERVRCRFLAGCDGGNSMVRQQIGIGLGGQSRVARRYMTHFRSDARALLQAFGVAWHYQSAAGTLIAQNDRDIWTLHTRWPDNIGPDDVDAPALVRAFAGRDFGFEVLVANAWTPHLLLADAYAKGRVLLAGDAAHQYIPTGGYGMNTGIGDACGLGWKLAATLAGFGGPGLLAAYEAERRPVGARNRDASGRHTRIRMEIGALYAGDLASEHGRAEAGRRIAALGNAENESFGVEMGYAYAGSPVVCTDPDAVIPDDPVTYVPTTAPGARLPSVFLDDGTAVYDRLGSWFTLLCVARPASAALVDAARRRGLPLTLLPLGGGARDVYGESLILVRPDQHVAWRGPSCDDPDEGQAIVDRVLGWGGR